MDMEEIEKNFEEARKFLAVFEELSMVQKESYPVHNQRLEGVKFLWNRIQILKAMETALLEESTKRVEAESLDDQLQVLETMKE